MKTNNNQSHTTVQKLNQKQEPPYVTASPKLSRDTRVKVTLLARLWEYQLHKSRAGENMV
jgi:hypothetical protein